MSEKKRFVLIVQGEGRGHLTQCIAMQDALVAAGHIVSRIIIGKTPHRKLPQFVYEKMHAPIASIESPTFVLDKKSKGIKISASILHNLLRVKRIRQSIKNLQSLIKEDNPHVIINFYDPVLSLLYFFKRPPFLIVSVAHQNIFLHPGYRFPAGHFFDRLGLKLFTRLNSHRAQLRIALSLYPLPAVPQKNIIVTAPLLRKEVFEQEIRQENYLLVYLVNPGYLEDIEQWSRQNPEQLIHCFCDRDTKTDSELLTPTLRWHRINDINFLDKLAGCSALVSTAGFETVAESMYFGKAALLVPVAGHFEQYCNAHDAEFAGTAIFDTDFAIDRLLTFTSSEQYNGDNKQEWIRHAAHEIIHSIENTVSTYDTN